MAIQAHLYPENLGLPLSSQDYFFLNNNNNNNFVNNNMMINNNSNSNNLVYNGCGMNELSFNNLQQKLVQQQQQQQQLQYQQQQQQYLIQLQNLRKRNASFVNVNNNNNNNNSNSLGFSQPLSKKQKHATDPATTTATTTSTITSESDNNNNNNNDLSMNISQSLSAQLEKQRQEIDRYITLQNERLKLALQEQRKQQFGAIIKKFEAKAMELLRQKDEEIAEATKKTLDMQEMMRKLELENQAWQRVAVENEAMVVSLSNTLEKLKEQQQQQHEQQRQQEACSSSSSNCVDDDESCCNEETGENRGVFGFEEKEASSTRTQGLCCKVCKSRDACVLLLPCRHMCCCNVCDAVLDACPLCKSPKKASIVALIS